MTVYLAHFDLDGDGLILGELTLNGPSTSLLFRTRTKLEHSSASVLAGRGIDGTYVSCGGCICLGDRSSYRAANGELHTRTLFPHVVVIGDAPFDQGSSRVVAVRFTTTDLGPLSFDPRTSGFAFPTQEVMEALLGSPGAKATDGALAAYFNAPHEIVAVDTIIGRVSIRNHTGASSGSAEGIALKNQVTASMTFNAGIPLDEAERRIGALRRFLSMLAGREQTVPSFVVDYEDDDGAIHTTTVTSTMVGNAEAARKELCKWDLPLDPNARPEEFARVLAAWIAREGDRITARVTFGECAARGHRFTVDRLVAAANMFDLLPADDVPDDVAVPEELAALVSDMRGALKKQAHSPQRDSLLSSLGRVGKASLTSKVLHRASLLPVALRSQFPDLSRILIFAVKCRNHCVHGGALGIDRRHVYSAFPEVTRALEFVFLCSELIDCGWEVDQWLSRSYSMSHPLCEFRGDYQRLRKSLKDVSAI